MTNRRSSLIHRRLAALALVLALLLPILPARAVSQSDIDALQEKRDALEEQAKTQQEEIDRLTESKALFVVRKLALDQQIETNRQEIKIIGEQVELYNQMIRQKEEELDVAIDAEANQSDLLRSRMRAMEENGSLSYVSVLLSSHNLTDLLSRVADISDITRYDRELEASYRSARSDVETISGDYKAMLAQQEVIQSELSRKQAYLDEQVEAASTLLAHIDEESEDAQAEYDAMNQELEKADAEITKLVAQLEADRKAAAAAAAAAKRQQQQAAAAAGGSSSGSGGATGGSTGGGVTSASSLIWPVPSCTLVTSRFGSRTAPTAGATSYHGGLDIGAGVGASVVAAGPGNVILASYNGGYGNCVMVDHGNGIVTLYGHMSSIAVSSGQYVAAGQVVGYVGSTGVSTGPHLHFEIRINGGQTDPAAYFGGLSYYNC